MPKMSENETPSLLFDEQSAAPSTPATGFWRAYFKSDGLYVVDDAGTETGPLGSGGGSSSNLTGTYDIEGDGAPTYTDAGLSDEFDAGTLDAQWTVVTGASGTVDLVGTVASPTYDLTTRSGDLLVQWPDAGSNIFEMRAALSGMSVGDSIVVAGAFPKVNTTSSINNVAKHGVSITSSSTGFDAGNQAYIYFDPNDNNDIKVWDGSTVAGAVIDGQSHGRTYFRVTRDATDTFTFFHSPDGVVWTPVTTETVTSAAYLWLFTGSDVGYTNNSDSDPISAFHWVRHVANQNLDPW